MGIRSRFKKTLVSYNNSLEFIRLKPLGLQYWSACTWLSLTSYYCIPCNTVSVSRPLLSRQDKLRVHRHYHQSLCSVRDVRSYLVRESFRLEIGLTDWRLSGSRVPIVKYRTSCSSLGSRRCRLFQALISL